MFRTQHTRRAALTGIATLTASAVGVGALYGGTEPAVAAETDEAFLAEDVRVERNDGRLERVTVAPALDVAWRNFGGGLESIGVTLTAAIADEPGFDTLHEADLAEGDSAVSGADFDAADGSAEIGLDRVDLTAVGDAVTVSDFGGELAPGESATTTVELALRVDVEGKQEEVETTVETPTFGVTVHNPEGSATVGGTADADAA